MTKEELTVSRLILWNAILVIRCLNSSFNFILFNESTLCEIVLVGTRNLRISNGKKIKEFNFALYIYNNNYIIF